MNILEERKYSEEYIDSVVKCLGDQHSRLLSGEICREEYELILVPLLQGIAVENMRLVNMNGKVV